VGEVVGCDVLAPWSLFTGILDKFLGKWLVGDIFRRGWRYSEKIIGRKLHFTCFSHDGEEVFVAGVYRRPMEEVVYALGLL
jgi:hypothetical protein